MSTETLPLPGPSPSDDEIVGGIADEIAARVRRGERPTVDEFVARHPDLADRLRKLVPAMLAMAAAADGPADRVHLPPRLGRYRVLQFLGGGGMGLVYEAVAERPDRPNDRVALKILLPNRAADLDRFRHEAAAVKRLSHPNIVPIYGLEEADGYHFLVMRLIDGESVGRIVADLRAARDLPSDPDAPVPDSVFGIPASGVREPDTPSVADRVLDQPTATFYQVVMRLAVQAADALAHAHARGVVHRDVKPSNILVDGGLKAWVVDFGLAKRDGEESLTGTGEVVGTLRYMAPERFRDESGPACDVYGLGVTVYEMLTLRAAFPHQDKQELRNAVRSTVPPRPRAVDPHVPADLEAVVLKAIAPDPADRYRTMADFRDDLQRFLDGRPPAAGEGRPWTARTRTVAVVFGLAVLGLFALAVQNRRLTDAVGRLQKDHDAAAAGAKLAKAKHLEALLAQATAVVQSRRAGQRYQALKLLDEADALADEIGGRAEQDAALRNATVAALAVPDLLPATDYGRYPEGSRGFDIHPDQRLSARIEAKGAIALQRGGGDEILLEGTDYRAVEFSPRGNVLFTRTAANVLKVWSLGPPQPRRGYVVEDVQAWHARADGRTFAVLTRAGKLTVRRVADGQPVGPEWPVADPRPNFDGWQVCLHPAKPLVAVTNPVQKPHVSILNTETGRTVADLPVSGPTACAWHPDGGTLVVAAGTAIERFTVGDGVRRLDPRRAEDVAVEIAFAPTGDALAVRGREVVTVFDAATGRRLVASPVVTDGLSLRWSRDGRRLAGFAARGRLRTWAVDLGREFRVLPAPVGVRAPATPGDRTPDGRTVLAFHPARPVATVTRDGRTVELDAGVGVGGGSLSPDGRWAVLLREDMTDAVVWDVTTRQRVLHVPAAAHGSPAFSADGRWLWVNTDGGWLRTVGGNWKPVVQTGPGFGRPAFTADGTTMALETGEGVVRLIETTTGRELAALTNPHGSILTELAFSPAGDRLVGTAERGVHVWELGRIRAELVKKNRDWRLQK